MSDPRLVLRAVGALREFNEAGVLAAADLHVARRLAELAGEEDEAVMLAAALAVRGPRLGHVYVDVATIRDTVTVDSEEPVDLGALPWPDAEGWLARLAASPLVAVGEEPADPRPLRLVGSALYLDRYWREERQVAADLLALAGEASGAVPDDLARLFEPGRQRDAAETALRRRFAVIAGGPGTGKTTTVARALALILEQGDPLVALAAPTGRPPRGSPRPCTTRRRSSRSTSACGRGCWPSRPRPCTACSAGGRTRAAASATTAATGSRTTSWWSTRRRWCRSRGWRGSWRPCGPTRG
jgi:exodeoxyribonuclease V alpha subunit